MVHDGEFVRPWLPWRIILEETRRYGEYLKKQIGSIIQNRITIQVFWKPHADGG